MKKEKSQKVLLSGIAMVVLFILWTVAISLIDVQPIGPQNSSVGFATLNGFIHSLTGVHSCHSLRHTFTTRMCEAGVNVKVIQDTLGHKDISTTLNIYTDVTKELRKSEFEGLDSYFKNEYNKVSV